MIEVFKGNVLVELDIASEKKGGLTIISKTTRNRNKGKVISGHKFKPGSHLFFFPRSGVHMDGKALIEEKDVVLIFKKNSMELQGDRIIIEPEEESKLTEGGVIVPDTLCKTLPLGKIIMVGDEVTKYSVGQRVFFDKDRSTDVTGYKFIEGKILFLVNRSMDIIAVL